MGVNFASVLTFKKNKIIHTHFDFDKKSPYGDHEKEKNKKGKQVIVTHYTIK